MNLIDTCKTIIKSDEESNRFSTKPYRCTEGYPTIGWGFKVGEKGDPLPNITMTPEEGEKKLAFEINDILDWMQRHDKIEAAYSNANDVRRAVMLSISYQVGKYGLLKFHNMLKALSFKDYHSAARECLDSVAARQAPQRWARNAEMLKTGELLKYYGGK